MCDQRLLIQGGRRFETLPRYEPLEIKSRPELYSSERYAEAEAEAEQLVNEYYDVLGLSPEDVFAKNPPDIWPKIKNPSTCHDELKRLADTLDLYAKSRNKQRLDSVLAGIHAFKFYSMASALVSAVRLGQDFGERGIFI